VKRLAVACVTLLGGCAWSNSLYQARHAAGDAARAEREARPGEAQAAWTSVVLHADSAYARSPRGKRGAEALWLAGHASVRLNDCARAVPSLEAALFAFGNAPWRSQLLLELGQCEEATGSASAASVYAMLIGSTGDPAIRRQARIRQGHVLTLESRWTDALAVLDNADTVPARLDRAMALAQLGQADRALADLEPSLAASDTTIHWLNYIEAFAPHGTQATDSLLARLLAFRNAREAQRAEWLFAGARAALLADPPAADRRLRQLVTRAPGRWVNEGAMLQAELRITRASSPAPLREVIDSLRRAPEMSEGVAPVRLNRLRQGAQQVLGPNDSTRAGAVGGDLVMFALAEYARDSLGAPRLAAWCFGRLERDWPGSPYVPKALLARSVLEPDSSAELIARARQHAGSPYLTAAAGDVAGAMRRSRLEDSLGKFISAFWIHRPPPTRAIPDRE
jgi:tetratricopeptide (TPR) repeat protein